jgi:hypothetical protein
MEGDMLKSLTISTVMLSSLAAGAAPAPSTEFGSIAEAKAMLLRAVTELHTDETSAINKFNFNRPGFRDRDLFVFCFNRQDGKFTAHEALVASDVRNLRDAVGRAIGDAMYSTAKEDQLTEIAFESPVPGRTGTAPKLAYVTAVSNQVCGVSAYLFNRALGPDAGHVP